MKLDQNTSATHAPKPLPAALRPTWYVRSMRITSKGQVTIPAQIRERAGLLPNTEVDFVVSRGSVRIIRKVAKTVGRDRGDRAVAALRGTATTGRSTDRILRVTRDR